MSSNYPDNMNFQAYDNYMASPEDECPAADRSLSQAHNFFEDILKAVKVSALENRIKLDAEEVSSIMERIGETLADKDDIRAAKDELINAGYDAAIYPDGWQKAVQLVVDEIKLEFK